MPQFRARVGQADVAIQFTDVGDGPAILLVHGFPLDGRIWDDVVPILAGNYRLIVPDLPGFGRSAIEPNTFTMELLAASLDRLMDSLSLDTAVCVGLSMGGYVIQTLARQFPQRVRGLSLVDTRANADDDAGRAARDKMIELVRAQGTSGVVEQMLPKMLAPQTQASAPIIVARLKGLMLDQSPLTIAAACAAMRDRRDFNGALATLACPLQIIVGEADAIAPLSVATAMHDATKGSRLDVIEGAGHMAPIERAERVASVLRSFVDEIQ